jgi:hypothetical protein
MPKLRSFLWFLAGFVTSLVLLIYLYHHLPHSLTADNLAVCLGTAFSMGILAGSVLGASDRPLWFSLGTCAAGLTVLFPFVVITYGYALIALPFVVLWTLVLWIGVRFGTRIFRTSR